MPCAHCRFRGSFFCYNVLYNISSCYHSLGDFWRATRAFFVPPQQLISPPIGGGREEKRRNSAEKVNFSHTSATHLTYLGSPEEVHHCGWWHVTKEPRVFYFRPFSFALHSNQIKQYTRPAIFLLQENASIDLLRKTPTSSIGVRTKAALRETPKAALRKTPTIDARVKATLRETPKAALCKTPTKLLILYRRQLASHTLGPFCAKNGG